MPARMLTLAEMRAIWGDKLTDAELTEIARRAFAVVRVMREISAAQAAAGDT